MTKFIFLIKTVISILIGNTRRSYEAKHALLHAVALRWGFRVYNRNLTWHNDDDYKQVWSSFPQVDHTVHERRFNLYNLARGVRAVPGDIVECGVFEGAGSFLMLSAQASTNKKLFGFDSFEGLSKPEDVDIAKANHTFHWKQYDMSVEEGVAANNLSQFKDRVTLFRGWIPERFDEVSDRRFCLVHVDVDLYEPTREAIRFFLPRLNLGGILICDDYGFESCPGARRAMDEVAAEYGTSVIHLTTGQGLILKIN